MKSILLAYSGGIDSTLLMKAIKISGIKALAVMGNSPSVPEWDIEDAKEMARLIGVELELIETGELNNDKYASNPPDRCFYCKDELFGRLNEIRNEKGLAFLADGSNCDDLNDYRPGRNAAIGYGVRSPLIEAGLAKEDVRGISKELGIPIWNKPSSPCLSSRFTHGIRITEDGLKMVSHSEKYLRSLGFFEFRVRHEGDIARIELREEDISKLLALRKEIVDNLLSFGYRRVTLDLAGFRTREKKVSDIIL